MFTEMFQDLKVKDNTARDCLN